MYHFKIYHTMSVSNYARFFALFKQLTMYGDELEQRHLLVEQASRGRTTSLRELTPTEYADLCSSLEWLVADRVGLRKARSKVLRLMTAIGIDTSDWGNVDDFTLQSRIAGRRFRHLTLDDLAALERKLRAIAAKQPQRPMQGRANIVAFTSTHTQQLPS